MHHSSHETLLLDIYTIGKAVLTVIWPTLDFSCVNGWNWGMKSFPRHLVKVEDGRL
jgi:hypothetical protein